MNVNQSQNVTEVPPDSVFFSYIQIYLTHMHKFIYILLCLYLYLIPFIMFLLTLKFSGDRNSSITVPACRINWCKISPVNIFQQITTESCPPDRSQLGSNLTELSCG